VRSNGISLNDVRASLVVRLRARRPELEAAIVARVRAVSESPGKEDAEYVAGLCAAIKAAVDHSLSGIELGEEWREPIPSAAAAQARRAARYGVSLDAVLRRCTAGDRLLADFVMDEGDRFPKHALRQVLSMQAMALDRLMASIAGEYLDEVDRAARSPEQRRTERVQRLLAGAPGGSVELDYELNAWHLGVIATGAKSKQALEGLVQALGCAHLLVPGGERSDWAWLGGQRRPEIADVERVLANRDVDGVALAVGEPARGIEGWRMTHRQAQRALWVALRRPRALTRYADVLLLAPAMRDDVLARSLREIYILPLAGQRDGGTMSCETLRTYFASGRNAATAAAALNVNRHTVERRLHKIEARLGRSLHTCQAELEVALSLDALDTDA
jgi:PucR C-terminal helix-turn-helix domain